jgi:hypothetical protein
MVVLDRVNEGGAGDNLESRKWRVEFREWKVESRRLLKKRIRSLLYPILNNINSLIHSKIQGRRERNLSILTTQVYSEYFEVFLSYPPLESRGWDD